MEYVFPGQAVITALKGIITKLHIIKNIKLEHKNQEKGTKNAS
jgi:hypothetical protein